MAMVVKNNMAAVRTLNTLNSNSSALQKSLAKVSSGMKINSAQDDASGYAISERMRVQIRALDQANQNTQNGSSLMKTAEGAVASTIEILKTMKEKAINAATDTNTDDDRATIQKEINQFVDQIDDNALVTFNGKYLVEGSKVQSGEATYTALTNQSLAKGTTGETALTELQNRKDEALGILATDRITASYVKDGRTYATTFTASDTTLKGIFQKLEDIDTTSQIFADSSNKSVLAADPSLAVAEADSTTGTSGGYDRATLDTAKADLEAQLAAAKEAQATATGALGSIGNNAVTFGSTKDGFGNSLTAGYMFNSDVSVSGAAYDLAKALVDAANAGDIYSDGNSNNATGWNASLTKGLQDTYGANKATPASEVAITLVNQYSSSSDSASSDATIQAGTADLGTANKATPMINLTGLTTNGTNTATDTAAANVARSATSWDGVTGDSDTVKSAIDNAIKRLNSDNAYAKDASGTATSDAARTLATNLQNAYDAYAEALTAKNDADAAVKALEDKLKLVDTAITAIDAKVAADEAKAGMAEAIENTLNVLAHPAYDSTLNAGASDATVSMIGNNQYVQYQLVNSSKENNPHEVSMTTDGKFSVQYDSDESSLKNIAADLADKIASNIEYYVTGEVAADNKVLTAADAMRGILNSIGVSNNNTEYTTAAWNTGGATDSVRKGVFKATDYRAAYGTNPNDTSQWLVDTNSVDNWGNTNTAAPPDINGFAAAYDKYAQAAYSVTKNQKALDKVMADYSAPSSGGPALLSGNAIGLNTSGEIVKTPDETAGITITAKGEGLAGQIAGVTISVADAVGNAKKSVNASLNAFKTTIFAANESKEDTSLKLHVGGAANQSLSVGLMDMRSQALGLKGADGSVISVTTQDNANAAIAAFDNALSKALDQATTIGAIEARLEYTSSNLTTSSENVQAAESTIRDADMAKEMTTYTKNNVLLQAAQSMLAQANQNASAVLSLLQ